MPANRDYWKPDRVVYRRKPAKNRALLNKTRLVLVGCVIFLGLMYWGTYEFLHLDYFQITRISVTGTKSLSENEVQNYLAAEIEGERWHTLPNSNILFFSPALAGQKLTDHFPAIKSASVEKHFPGEIYASITERTLFAVYCEDGDDTGTSTPALSPSSAPCFFMDPGGVIFREAPRVVGTLILTFVSDGMSDVELGQQVLEPDVLSGFQQLAEAFAKIAGIAVNGFRLRKNAPDDAWVETGGGYSIIVRRDADSQKVAEIIKAVLENEIRDRASNLEYIDARFGNKVFVKYR